MLFDISDSRRHFRRVIEGQVAAKRQRMLHARQAAPTTPAPVPPLPPLGAALLSARQAMQWLGLGPTPFYHWRNRLGIRPVRKGARQALYLRRDVERIQAAYQRGSSETI